MCDCFQDSSGPGDLRHHSPAQFSHKSVAPPSTRKLGLAGMWPPTWVKVRLQLKVALVEEVRLTLSLFRLMLMLRMKSRLTLSPNLRLKLKVGLQVEVSVGWIDLLRLMLRLTKRKADLEWQTKLEE